MIEIKVVRETPEAEAKEVKELIVPQSVFDDVAILQQQMAEVLGSLEDSGWRNLELIGEVQAYNADSAPKYRKIGKIVFIKGAVKNVLARGTNVALLPEECRPEISISLTQNTSMRTGDFAMFSRVSVKNTGHIQIESISDGAAYAETKWFPIDCCFSVE